MYSSQGYLGLLPSGFPHSDITGSQPVYGSPALFVVSYVFHRCRLPRHPSYALSSLIIERKKHSKMCCFVYSYYQYAIFKEHCVRNYRHKNHFSLLFSSTNLYTISPFFGAYSSVGQSARLISVGSKV